MISWPARSEAESRPTIEAAQDCVGEGGVAGAAEVVGRDGADDVSTDVGAVGGTVVGAVPDPVPDAPVLVAPGGGLGVEVHADRVSAIPMNPLSATSRTPPDRDGARRAC